MHVILLHKMKRYRLRPLLRNSGQTDQQSNCRGPRAWPKTNLMDLKKKTLKDLSILQYDVIFLSPDRG